MRKKTVKSIICMMIMIIKYFSVRLIQYQHCITYTMSMYRLWSMVKLNGEVNEDKYDVFVVPQYIKIDGCD